MGIAILMVLLTILLPACGRRDTSRAMDALREFAGVPLTETRDVIGKIFPLSNCQTNESKGLDTVTCATQIPFGGAVRDAFIVFLGEGSDRFLSMTLTIGRADCDGVEADLSRRYGKPTEHSAETGAIHDLWKGKRMGIRLERPSTAGPGQLWVGLTGPIAFIRNRPL